MSVTVVTLTSSPAGTSPAGLPVLLTASLSNVGAIPTGTVTFKDGAAVLGAIALDGTGIASMTTSTLAMGLHTITAEYGGDTSYDPATSSPVQLTVRSATDVSLSTSPPNAIFGQELVLQALVGFFPQPGGEIPTGTVTFKDGAAVLGAAAVNASGEAQLSTWSVPSGSRSLTVEYSGDTIFEASTSAPAVTPIAQATATVELVITPKPAQAGRPTTAQVTVSLVSPSTAAPTGTVTLLDGATQLGAATLDSEGRASITTTELPTGTRSLTVAYAGTPSIQAATSPAVLVMVLAQTAFDLVAAEDALHAWVETALGLPAIWSHPNAPSPERPFGWLTLAGPVRLGRGELVAETDLGAPAGQEIAFTSIEHEEWSFSVDVVSEGTSGASSARAVLAAAAMRMRLPSALEALSAAGLAVVDFGDTQDLTALFATAFESRARLDVRIRTVNTATERTGYIATVGISESPQLSP